MTGAVYMHAVIEEKSLRGSRLTLVWIRLWFRLVARLVGDQVILVLSMLSQTLASEVQW